MLDSPHVEPIEMVRKKNVYIVYQCGIANVFVEYAGRLMRKCQGSFSQCENFCRGAVAVGMNVHIKHCDKAGDIAICQDEWKDGSGDLFWDKKNYS